MTASRPACAHAQPVDITELRTPYARKIVARRKIDELKRSIETVGLKEPIHVSARGNVVSGNCRLLVFRELGRPEIPCFLHSDLADEQSELAFLFAADTKSDRSPVDSAFLVKEFVECHQSTWEAAAKSFSISPATASRFKSLTEMIQCILDALRAERITLTQALELKQAPVERQPELLQRVIADKLTPKELRELIRGRKGGKKKPLAVPLGAGVVLHVPHEMKPDALMALVKDSLSAAIDRAGIKRDAVGNFTVSDLAKFFGK